MEAQDNPGFRDILKNALLTTPDGMPMVWIGKLQGQGNIARVYGPDLMLNLCENSREHNFSHFFYGGAAGVADELARRLQQRFPGLMIAGTYTPPFRPLNAGELADLQTQVEQTRPIFFWLGLSTPKQEWFMAKHVDLLPQTKVMVGVGAAFDLLTGRVKQRLRQTMEHSRNAVRSRRCRTLCTLPRDKHVERRLQIGAFRPNKCRPPACERGLKRFSCAVTFIDPRL